MEKNNLLIAIASLAILGLTKPVYSHYLWIEKGDSESTAKVYFGEYNEGLREKSGGKLDKFTAVKAYSMIPNGAEVFILPVKMMDDHFLISKIPAGSIILVRDEEVEVADYSKSGIGIVKPIYYARTEIPGEAKFFNNLDILPVTKSPGSFLVFFKGKPLADAKANIYAPNLWMQEFKTDKDGLFKISTPWPGQYVLDVVYKEEMNGVFKGKSYEAIRHRSTYTFFK